MSNASSRSALPWSAWAGGLLAGLLFACVRPDAELALDLSGTAHAWIDGLARAVVAAGIAFSLVHAARTGASGTTRWLWGACIGACVLVLVLARWFDGARALAAAPLGVFLFLVSRAHSERVALERTQRAWLVGSALIGAALGSQIAATCAASAVLGDGTRAESGLQLVVIAGLALAAALAVAPWRARAAETVWAWPLLALAGGVAVLDSHRMLELWGVPDEVRSFLGAQPWNSNLDALGSWSATALLTARVSLLSAFAVGLAFAWSHPQALAQRLAAALFGALACPLPLPRPLALIGVVVAWLAWSQVDASRIARGGAALLALSVAWIGVLEQPPLAPLDPRVSRERVTSNGTGVAAPWLSDELALDGTRTCVFRGRRWSPDREGERIETLLARELHQARTVLLVGPLTPARERMLRARGATRIDRTAPFHERLEFIEAQLYDAQRVDPRLGVVLDPDDARAALARGDYDAVFVPPQVGDDVALGAVPEATSVSHWREASTARRRLADGARVELRLVDGELLFIAPRADSATSASSATGTWAFQRVAMRSADRRRRERVEFVEGLLGARAWSAPLAAHLRAQVESSPFEDTAQRVELDDAALDALAAAARTPPLDTTVRAIWNDLAGVLEGKRDLERIERCLLPLAEIHAIWPELERALAVADLEMLDPSSAAQRLDRALQVALDDPKLRVLRARAALELDDFPRAESELARALELAPDDADLRRALATTRARMGRR